MHNHQMTLRQHRTIAALKQFLSPEKFTAFWYCEINSKTVSIDFLLWSSSDLSSNTRIMFIAFSCAYVKNTSMCSMGNDHEQLLNSSELFILVHKMGKLNTSYCS